MGDIDYMNKPESVRKTVGDAPGSFGYTWPRHEHETVMTHGGDGLLDRIYDVDTGPKQMLATAMQYSSRKYASSFTSGSKRFFPQREQHELGPGSYEMPASAVQVRDAKRANYAFKSL